MPKKCFSLTLVLLKNCKILLWLIILTVNYLCNDGNSGYVNVFKKFSFSDYQIRGRP